MAWRSSGAAAFVVVTLMAPLAAGVVVVVSRDRSPLESSSPPAAVVGAVASTERTGETEVTVRLRPSDAVATRTAAMGLVTQVRVAAGDEVANGDVLVVVGEVDVVAYTSDRPLHTDIVEGASGPSVELAQTILAGLGHYRGEVDGRSRASTVAAIVAFNTAHGLGQSRVLSVASLAWLGPAPVTARDILVSAGDSLEPGAELFKTSSAYAAVEVTPGGAGLPDGDLVLDVRGRTAPLDRAAMAVTDPEFTAAVAEALGNGAEEGASGVVRRAIPVTVGVLPASAVVTDGQGRTCFFTSIDGDAVPVTPAGGALGSVDVDASLVGHPVLVNPREVRPTLGCA